MVSISNDKKVVRISHKEIPGLGWMAMEMDFSIADEKILKDLKPNDKIYFEVKTDDGKFTVTNLQSYIHQVLNSYHQSVIPACIWLESMFYDWMPDRTIRA